MSFRNAVYMICSPRPRVGRTMLARLLTDFFLINGRGVEAFDVNDEAELARHFPAQTTIAAVSGIRDQMALFDRLIAEDGAPKVVDIGNAAMSAFFDVVRETGFAAEARRRAIAPVILFMTSPDKTAFDAYGRLRESFAQLTIVPVYNEMLGRAQHRDKFPAGRKASQPVHLPMLAPGLQKYIAQPPFSFAGASTTAIPLEINFELQRWMRRAFVDFREMELRILLDDLQSALNDPA